MNSKRIRYVNRKETDAFARSFAERFPVSLNMLAGNKEKAQKILKEKEKHT